MNEAVDYLFDKQGVPDAEVEALERLFAPLAHDGRPLPDFALRAADARPRPVLRFAPFVAAALLLAALLFALLRGTETEPEVVLARGEPVRVVVAADAPRRVVAPGLAEFELPTGGELRIDAFDDAALRVHLVRGEVLARIASPFRKGEPSVQLATDLVAVEASWIEPCDLRLALLADGRGSLHVDAGEVLAVRGSRRLVVPAGASLTMDRTGLGWPLFDDCSDELRKAAELAAVYESKVGPEVHGKAAYGLVATASTPRDTLVLWNLLQLGEPASQAGVEMRLLELAGAPAMEKAKSWSADTWLAHLRAKAWRPAK